MKTITLPCKRSENEGAPPPENSTVTIDEVAAETPQSSRLGGGTGRIPRAEAKKSEISNETERKKKPKKSIRSTTTKTCPQLYGVEYFCVAVWKCSVSFPKNTSPAGRRGGRSFVRPSP